MNKQNLAREKVFTTIESLNDISQCNSASRFVDLYENQYGYSEDVNMMRDLLCDTTFKLYFEKYGK